MKKPAKKFEDIQKMVFTDRNQAVSFSNRCQKPMMAILGDYPQIWVVTMADGERLIRMGYEVA